MDLNLVDVSTSAQSEERQKINMNFITEAIIACVASAVISGAVVWEYQDNKFTAQIERTAKESEQELTKVQKEIIKQERNNHDVIEKLNREYSASVAKRDSVIGALQRRIAAAGGLYVSGSCPKATGTPITTSNSAPAEAGECRLSESVANAVVEEQRKGLALNEYAEACYAYTQEINKQRERITKDE